jgi:hypothetical protein
MQVLSYNLLYKFLKDEVPTAMIATTKKFSKGVQINWATFLVKQFLTNCIEEQKKGTKFHYAWILILIAMVGWQEPGYYQRMGTSGRGSMSMWCYEENISMARGKPQ